MLRCQLSFLRGRGGAGGRAGRRGGRARRAGRRWSRAACWAVRLRALPLHSCRRRTRLSGVWCAQGPTVSPSCACRSRGSELCGVCVWSCGAGGCALLSLSLSRLVREHWGQTVLSACGAQERRWRSTRTSWGWRPGCVFAGLGGRSAGRVGACTVVDQRDGIPPGLGGNTVEHQSVASRGRRLACRLRTASGCLVDSVRDCSPCVTCS